MKFSGLKLIVFGLVLSVTGGLPVPLSAQPMELVADLLPGAPLPDGFPDRGGYWRFGDRAIYLGDTGFWISDGSPAGTYPLGRTCPSCSSLPQFLGTTRHRAYWRNQAPGRDSWLWSSDGSPRGAAPVDESISFRSSVERSSFLFSGEAVYFGGFQEPAFGIWRYHPDEGPPQRLVRGVASRTSRTLAEFAELNGEVFFVAYGMGSGPGLFRTDGTAAGTRRLKSFGSEAQQDPHALTRVGDLLFFIADEGNGEDVWVSDGTAGGTRRLTEITSYGAFELRAWIRPWRGGAFFVARQDETWNLWTSDGTPEGTHLLTNFGSDGSIGLDGGPDAFVAAQDFILFSARESRDEPYVLWKADTFSANPFPVFGSGEGPVLEDRDFAFVTAGDRFFFPATRAAGGERLWVSDGTQGGTLPIESLCGPSCGGVVEGLTAIDGIVLFRRSEVNGGIQSLWRTDGTADGTWRLTAEGSVGGSGSVIDSSWIGRVSDGYLLLMTQAPLGSIFGKLGDRGEVAPIRIAGAGGLGSFPREFQAWKGDLAFIAKKPTTSLPDYAIRAVSPATLEIREVLPDPPWANTFQPEALVSAGEHLFIRLNRDQEIWSTDGTREGTVRLWQGGFNQSNFFQVAYGEELVFGVEGGESQCEIWKSDRSVSGARRILQLGRQFCSLGKATVVGDNVYFLMKQGGGSENEVSVLRLQPDTEEVQVLAHLVEENGNSRLEARPSFTEFDGDVYFFFDLALWRSSAGAQEAVRLVDIDHPPTFGPMARLGDQLYFLASGPRVLALWQTDGTAGGTVALREWDLSSNRVELSQELVTAGGRLWFPAYEVASGAELWTSDGTEAGTFPVSDLETGAGHSSPRHLIEAEGKLFFTAEDRFRGRELWTLEGLAPRLVQDLHPGPRGGMRENFRVFQESLWMAGDEGLRGFELWRLPLSRDEPGCLPGAERLCLQRGRFSVEALWQDFQGQLGSGKAVALSADTGYFWFFNQDNVEAILKVLDGRSNNGHFWSFYGALSNVEYHLTVRDTETGAARRYFNPLRSFASVGDTHSFGPLGAGALANPEEAFELDLAGEPVVTQSFDASVVGQPCAPTSTRLCLQEGRFAVEAQWEDFGGNIGVGQAVELTQDTGYFWFFRDTNVEAVLKVLDGRPNNGNFWVFYGALSNVDYDLKVTDCQTGAVKTYQNRNRSFASVGDTEAFPGG
ncbi:MAG: hypothetical protein K0U98_06660 [Deltaproteobacteria bacterium]|nr:hypothetical protein [Deltaproteobacteria bacterium]